MAALSRDDLERFASAAVAAAHRGAAVIAAAADRPRRVEEKSERDFVTEVDRASEAAIHDYLLGSFPDHDLLAEESATTASASFEGFQWIVDPLDGTTNFIHGFRAYGVSVALALEGEVVAGAVVDPTRGETYRAARGLGASVEGRPLRVSGAERMDRALLATGFPFREHTRTDAYLEVLGALMRRTAGIRRPGAACLDLAALASGRVDGFWEANLSAWDIAAGSLLIEEAGGVVSDFHGERGFLRSGDIVAAAPALFEPLLEACRPLRP